MVLNIYIIKCFSIRLMFAIIHILYNIIYKYIEVVLVYILLFAYCYIYSRINNYHCKYI